MRLLILLKFKKTKTCQCLNWKHHYREHVFSPQWWFLSLTVHGGWICGSGWAAELPRVWRAKAKDGRDRGRDGCSWALPHHLLHLSWRPAQKPGDLTSSSLWHQSPTASLTVSSLNVPPTQPHWFTVFTLTSCPSYQQDKILLCQKSSQCQYYFSRVWNLEQMFYFETALAPEEKFLK